MNHTLLGWCTTQNTNEAHKRTLNALRILAMWEIWKHRNAIVFEGATPLINHVLCCFTELGRNWKQAGLFKGDLADFFNQVAWGASAAS